MMVISSWLDWSVFCPSARLLVSDQDKIIRAWQRGFDTAWIASAYQIPERDVSRIIQNEREDRLGLERVHSVRPPLKSAYSRECFERAQIAWETGVYHPPFKEIANG